MTPGPTQLLIIILLVLVVFGAGRIPAIMENVAKGINSFKKGLKEEDSDKPLLKDEADQKEKSEDKTS